MRAKAITTPKFQAYVAKRLEEGAVPGTVNRELDCLHRIMILGQRHTPPKVILILHFPRLAEDNVREGFCEHDAYLCIRGASPYSHTSGGDDWILHRDAKRGDSLPPVG